MKKPDEEHERTKRYLLGDLAEEEQQQFEERVITDSDYREHAFIIEAELIDEYVVGSLTGLEREKFESHFLSQPQQLQRVRIAQALRLYAAGTTDASVQAAGQTVQKKKPLSILPMLRPRVLVPSAALLLLVVTLGSWAFYRHWQKQYQRAEIDRELAQLNSEPQGGAGPEHSADSVLSVKLLPLHLRNIEESQKIVVTAGVSVVELWLGPTNDEYQTYRVQIKGSQESDGFTIDHLKATTVGQGKVVRVKIPARLLTRGDYLVKISGLTAANQFEDVGDYYFRIVGP